MASSPGGPYSEPAVIEQVVTEFFAKSLHIILESRSPYASSRSYGAGDCFTPSPSTSSSSSGARPRDKWFNLALRDCPAALENFDLWRRSELDPLVVDVILRRRSATSEADTPDRRREKLVERWVVQYEIRKESLNSGDKRTFSSSSSQSPESNAVYRKTYKKSIVMLRSLYATVRLLPAYKVFRDLNSSGQLRPLSLSHRISFVEPSDAAGVEDNGDMAQFVFTPVETPCGRLCLSVSYLPILEDVSSEPSTPLSTQFIPDYVGSPTTSLLKKFQSLPSAGSFPGHVPFSRRHSCSNSLRASPLASASPSPTYSDSRTSHGNHNLRLPRSNSSHNHGHPRASSVPENRWFPHKYILGFDNCSPSPPLPLLSPYSSPSPALLVGGHLSKVLHTESAPLNVPVQRLHKNNPLVGQGLPPSPFSKPRVSRPGSCSPRIENLSVRLSTACLFQHESPQKVLPFGKDEVGGLPGLKIESWNSPRIAFSRSSSRFSLMDEEFDDPDFACPFAVDYEDATEACNRVPPCQQNSESGGTLPGRRSQEAAAGALVRMLRAAAPLSKRSAEIGMGFVVGSEDMSAASSEAPELSRPRTTAASALQELESYREMRNWLTQQPGSNEFDG